MKLTIDAIVSCYMLRRLNQTLHEFKGDRNKMTNRELLRYTIKIEQN
jgi:hypothetical protein